MTGPFLRRISLLGLPIVLATALYMYAYRDTFPAPRVTTNIALNEKLALFKRSGAVPPDIVAAGSSMALNNLDTRAVQEHFPGASYLNFGAWGLGLDDTRALIGMLQARHHARTVLICTNLMEFSTEMPGLAIDTAEMARYVWREREWTAYVRHPMPSYYLRQMESNRIRASDPGNYEYLHFDAGGGSTLDVPPERLDPRRWKKSPPPPERMLEEPYRIAADIGRRLRDQGTRLVWVHAPFREGLMDDALRERVRLHIERLRAILGPQGHVVVDGNDRTWPDSLFSDYSHLNARGAHAFTRYALARLGE